MIKLTEKQKETLEEVRTFYSKNLAEDPQDGSLFDCAVLDCLRDHFIEEWLNLISK